MFNSKKTALGYIALPTQQEFWDYLMETSRRWGLVVYEQDWLNEVQDQLEALSTDPQLGRTWLLQMGRAADKNGITIQYCMSLP